MKALLEFITDKLDPVDTDQLYNDMLTKLAKCYPSEMELYFKD